MNPTSLSSLWLLVFCFFSCQSYRTIEIGTYNPATITFPPEVKTIMIVNNAAQQPDNSLIQNGVGAEKDSTFSLSADSMAYLFCLALGKSMTESPVFDDVRLCDDTLRSDSVYIISRPFTPNDVKLFCDEYDVDALITLDKLYFKVFLINQSQNMYFKWSLLTVIVTGELKALCPGYQTALTIPFTDSLQWATEETLYYKEIIEFTSEDIQLAMRYLVEYAGEKMNKHYVPYWDSDTRWFYTNISSQWKRASSYAIAENWEEAANEWRPLFDKAKKWKQKAMLASNMALYFEIKGDFQKAIEYAEIANSLLKENTEEDNTLKLRQLSYLEALTKRAENDETLSLQLRE